MSYVYETTPYGVKQLGDKFVVHQFWWNEDVSDCFDTRDEAEQQAISLAKDNGCLIKVRIK
jgi:hypothetical protein